MGEIEHSLGFAPCHPLNQFSFYEGRKGNGPSDSLASSRGAPFRRKAMELVLSERRFLVLRALSSDLLGNRRKAIRLALSERRFLVLRALSSDLLDKRRTAVLCEIAIEL